MTSTNNAPATPQVANLHDTKRAQSAARKRHPAGRAAAAKVTAAKAASAKLAKAIEPKTPAKPAPVKKAAEKPAATSTKIKWTLDGEKDEHGRGAQHGTGNNGVVYAITGFGDSWKATATAEGMRAVLAEKVSHGSAYAAAVKHHREAIASAA
jgi:hypothetical protein